MNRRGSAAGGARHALVLAALAAACGSTTTPALPVEPTAPLRLQAGPSPAGLLSDRAVGRSGLACADCHRVPGPSADQASIRPGPDLTGVHGRARYWRGVAPNLGAAVNLCVERYLARPGLAPADLARVLDALDGPARPAEPARFATATPKTLEGDAARGADLYDRACRRCHEGGPAPPVIGEPWSSEGLARTIRGLDRPRHPGALMPPFSMEALDDAALADLVTAVVDAPLRPAPEGE